MDGPSAWIVVISREVKLSARKMISPNEMQDSDDCTFSLDSLFFQNPRVHKVKPLIQEPNPWLLSMPPLLSQIPATPVLQKEAESSMTEYSSYQCLTNVQQVPKATRTIENPSQADPFQDVFLPKNDFRETSLAYDVQSSDLSTVTERCFPSQSSQAPPPWKSNVSSLLKVPSFIRGGDSSNTDDVSGSRHAQTFSSRVTMATISPCQPPQTTGSQALPPRPSKPLLPPPPLGSSASRGRPQPQTAHAEMQDKGTKRAFVPPLTPQLLHIPGPSGSEVLRPVSEIPAKFRSVFDEFPFFNYIQSKAIDDVLYTDKNFVACAPTGSGKTVLFELAIIHLLMESSEPWTDVKAVYMAPIKALCSQCFDNWSKKFGPLGVNCKELTGDTEIDDLFEIQDSHIILTTPEKWDSMTRKWRDNSLLQLVRLFLIDEVHVVKDATRGATLEVVVSRMKAVDSYRTAQNPDAGLSMRFVAVSATIPNIADIADWLSNGNGPAAFLNMDESHRPVKLRKVVLGFPCGPNQSEFKFDLSLNYKMASIIQTYSDQKPSLVFCSTRKGAQQSATVLARDTRFIIGIEQKHRLIKYSQSVADSKLRELVLLGVGYHHAGMELSDRKLVEYVFSQGDLPVLFTTRTLAMGVNLPAHLVVIKSTMQYVAGSCEEYSESDLLQMIGRAGRPQFDSSATAVIMTKAQTRDKYTKLMSGMEIIESSLHGHLVEHLNAEIVLQTISDVNMALDWIRSTFLYIRALKNPTHYGFSADMDKFGIEEKLQELCLKNLNSLSSVGLIELDEDINIKPTEAGRLMARYCVAFETMNLFTKVSETEELADLVALLAKSREFNVIQLRVTEKRQLNTFNKDKNRVTIRFPLSGKIKTSEMKVNCLIQAQLGSILIQDFGLVQDTAKIFRIGMRISKCLSEFLSQKPKRGFCSLLNSLILAKCFRAKLWENSIYVSKQLDKIGQTLSTAMVNAGLTTFSKIEQANPRELELILNRHPPFGNQIIKSVVHLPQYGLGIDQLPRYSCTTAEILVKVSLKNQTQLSTKRTAPDRHYISLVVGDSDNNVVFLHKLSDSVLLKCGTWSRKIDVAKPCKLDEICVNLISSEYVGLDIQQKFSLYFSREQKYQPGKPLQGAQVQTGPQALKALTQSQITFSSDQGAPGVFSVDNDAPMRHLEGFSFSAESDGGSKRRCNHHCKNKQQCGHECCKVGVTVPQQKQSSQDSRMFSYLRDLRDRQETDSETPAKRLKKALEDSSNLQRFSYQTKSKLPSSSRIDQFYAPPPHMEPVDVAKDNCLYGYQDIDDCQLMMEESVPAGTTTYKPDARLWLNPAFSVSHYQKPKLSHLVNPYNCPAPGTSFSPANSSTEQIPTVNFNLMYEHDDWSDFDDENLVRASETSMTSCGSTAPQVQQYGVAGSTAQPPFFSESQIRGCAASARTPLRSLTTSKQPQNVGPSPLTVKDQSRITLDCFKKRPSSLGEQVGVKAATQNPVSSLSQRFDFFLTNTPANSNITADRSSLEETSFGIFDGIF
ncbi:putative ATP-dependent DNA helicase HFM1 isoform 1-T1 [Synchiropus picturatus]